MKKLAIATIFCMAWLGEAGNGNVVVGNGNVVQGNSNVAKGNENSITGNSNVQMGDLTSIFGSNNFNQGNNKQIFGDNHYVSSEHPEYAAYGSSDQSTGQVQPQHASFDIWGTVNNPTVGNGGSHLTFEQPQTQQGSEASQSSPQTTTSGSQGMSDVTRDFLENRRQQILSSLQGRLRNRFNSPLP